MKKRASRVKKSSSRKSSSRKNIKHVLLLPFSFRRIVLVTTCISLFVVGVIFVKGEGRQSVAGLSITSGLFVQATVQLPKIEGAAYYNLYYKEKNEEIYKNAVRSIPTTETAYIISYLSKGAEYVYKVSAANGVGAEFWWSGEKPLENLQTM